MGKGESNLAFYIAKLRVSVWWAIGGDELALVAEIRGFPEDEASRLFRA